jgi:hypothetical protein
MIVRVILVPYRRIGIDDSGISQREIVTGRAGFHRWWLAPHVPAEREAELLPVP